MRTTRNADRPDPCLRMNGSLSETTLVAVGTGPGVSTPRDGGARGRATEGCPAPDHWELVLVHARAGTSVLPVPFATDEAGYVVSGQVELTQLPEDYDVSVSPGDQGRTEILGPGDAFSIERGDRVMIDVLVDLRFLVWRRVAESISSERPPGVCG